MFSGWIEVATIFFLIGVNGFFACSEIAIIAVRRSRIKQLMEQGDQRAKSVHHLQKNPEQFLATIQIGVTVASSLAAAIGGVLAVKKLEPLIQQIPNKAVHGISEFLAVGTVVLVISYFSLIIGELVPKSLALKYSETIALAVGRPIVWMSRMASSVTNVLTWSSGLILRFFKGSPTSEKASISEEEIKILVQEGRAKGIFDETEMKLIHGVFEFTDISVKEVMVPRHKVKALQFDISSDELLKFIVSHKFSRYPVFREGMNDIIGILYFKAVMEQLIKKEKISLETLIRPAYFVPETMKINHLLRELQRRKIQMAIVVNEYGNVEGVATLEDLIEEIVGEIEDEHEHDREERPVERLKDGSMVVDASLSIRDLEDDYGLALPESGDYETLGGFFLSQLQNMPRGGEIIRHGGYKFTIVDMDGRRIAKIKVEKHPGVPQKISI